MDDNPRLEFQIYIATAATRAIETSRTCVAFAKKTEKREQEDGKYPCRCSSWQEKYNGVMTWAIFLFSWYGLGSTDTGTPVCVLGYKHARTSSRIRSRQIFQVLYSVVLGNFSELSTNPSAPPSSRRGETHIEQYVCREYLLKWRCQNM